MSTFNQTKACNVRDVPAAAFIAAYAEHLKRSGKIELPKNHEIMKTCVHNELSPLNDDWYYIKTAAIARRVYLRPGTGIGALRKAFGSKKDNGVRRGHFAVASAGIIRHCLHSLEALGVIEKDQNKGRKVTKEGQKELDTIAVACVKN